MVNQEIYTQDLEAITSYLKKIEINTRPIKPSSKLNRDVIKEELIVALRLILFAKLETWNNWDQASVKQAFEQSVAAVMLSNI